MGEIASFRVDFETNDAQNNVDALADATTAAMHQMEDETQSSMAASGQDMERLADIFRASGTIIESAITALIQKEEELARQTNETAEEGSKFREVFTTIGTGLAVAGAAIAATVTAIGALVQTTTAAIVETDNYAQAVGISTEAMQAFQFAAQRVGGDTDALRESLRTSQDAIAQFVNDGTGPAAEALELLGLQLTDSSGKVRSMEQLLPELTTALGNIRDPAERSRLAMQLFGEEDSRVMLALANNPTILAESATALEKYGLAMGKDLVQQSREFQTGVTDLMASLQGLAQELVAALLPTLNALLPQFTAWVVSLRESDTVQKELIPTLQAIIGYLGEVGLAVDVLSIGWAALNTAFNAAVMVILEGVGKIAQGLGTIMTAAGQAADFLGMDGVAEKLRSAGAAVTSVGVEADEMGDIARESMQEWQQSLTDTIANLGKTTTATQQTTTATQTLGQEATQAGKEVIAAWVGMTEAAVKAQAQAKELREAYSDLGIKSGEALQKFRTDAVADFTTIRQSGTETPERIADLWEELVPTLLDEYGKLPPAYAEMDRQIMASAKRATTEIQHAYDTLGLETTQAMEETARKQIEAFVAIVRENKKSIQEQKDLYEKVLVPAIQAATGRMAPPFEVFYGIVKNGANDATEHLKKVFAAAGKAVGDTMGPISQLLVDLGIKTEQELRGAAQSAERNLLTVVSIFGVRSKEAAQAWQETIGDISAGYERLPPHIERIGRLIAEANQKSATDSEAAHRRGTDNIKDSYSRMFEEIAARSQRLTDQLNDFSDASAIRFGTTLEELQRQAAYYTNVIANLSITQLGSAYQGVRESFQRVLEEIQRRIADLQDEEETGTETTTTFAKALSGTSTAVQETATALSTLTARQVAYNASLQDYSTVSSGIRPAIMTRPIITGGSSGGTGNGGTSNDEPTDPGGLDNRDSLVIGQGPGQLPVGVPLPTDLGMTQGGTGFATHRTLGGSNLTQNTVINVNEPITVQTKADSSTLTAQAVVNALNDGLRRGILRPELGNSIR